MKLSRKDFIWTAIAAAGAAAGLGASGCGSSDDSGGGGGNGDCSAAPTAITDNHSPPHSVTVTKAQIDAGGTQDISIQGKADHDHTITLTDSHFAKLKVGKGVSVVSSHGPDGHIHDVTLSC
jgi:hypothetical protein